MAETRTKRRTKLIRRSFQLQLAGSLAGMAGLALLLQFLLLAAGIAAAAKRLGAAGDRLSAELPAMMLQVFGLTLLVLVPVLFSFAVVLTFRIAGPIHRFKEYLTAVLNGEQTGPCRIRDGDQLEDLCDLINRATEPVRREAAEARARVDERGARAA